MPESNVHDGGNRVFDFIDASDLIVLGVAAAATALALTITHWMRTRGGGSADESSDDSQDNGI